MSVPGNVCQPVTKKYKNTWGTTLLKVAASLHVMAEHFLFWCTSGYTVRGSLSCQPSPGCLGTHDVLVSRNAISQSQSSMTFNTTAARWHSMAATWHSMAAKPKWDPMYFQGKPIGMNIPDSQPQQSRWLGRGVTSRAKGPWGCRKGAGFLPQALVKVCQTSYLVRKCYLY